MPRFDFNQAGTTSVWQTCWAGAGTVGVNVTLACIATQIEDELTALQENLTYWLLILTGAMVFFMQTGFAMLCAGCVRQKNVQNTLLKNLLDACGAAISFYVCGYAFAFGSNDPSPGKTFIGNSNFFLMDGAPEAFYFFQFAFTATAVTIVAGTLAERCQMGAYFLYAILLVAITYPVIVHWIWSPQGYLSPQAESPLADIGVLDFSGSGVVHVTGGTTALIATSILGPRQGRFFDRKGRPLDVPKVIRGHSIALQLLGTTLLWFCWLGFNSGSALLLVNNTVPSGKVAGLSVVNTCLSAASGAISALFTNLYIQERATGEYSFDLRMAINGTISGLVAVTSGCAVIEHWAAIIIGIVSGWLYILGSRCLLRFKLDDAVDAIPCHLVNGVWGMLATGLLANGSLIYGAYGTTAHEGLFYSWGAGGFDATLLGIQALGVTFIFVWTTVNTLPFFMWLQFMGWFRTDSLEEIVGLDIHYHGVAPETISRSDDVPSKNDIREWETRRIGYYARQQQAGRLDDSNEPGAPNENEDEESHSDEGISETDENKVPQASESSTSWRPVLSPTQESIGSNHSNTTGSHSHNRYD